MHGRSTDDGKMALSVCSDRVAAEADHVGRADAELLQEDRREHPRDLIAVERLGDHDKRDQPHLDLERGRAEAARHVDRLAQPPRAVKRDIDELAAEIGADPLELVLLHHRHERAQVRGVGRRAAAALDERAEVVGLCQFDAGKHEGLDDAVAHVLLLQRDGAADRGRVLHKVRVDVVLDALVAHGPPLELLDGGDVLGGREVLLHVVLLRARHLDAAGSASELVATHDERAFWERGEPLARQLQLVGLLALARSRAAGRARVRRFRLALGRALPLDEGNHRHGLRG